MTRFSLVIFSLFLLLPLVIAFYLSLALMEDSGYLPRLATLVDRSLNALGLNGAAIIPLILGFGCVTMATITRGTATAVPANRPGVSPAGEPAGVMDGKTPRKERPMDSKGTARVRRVRRRLRIAGDGGRRSPVGRELAVGPLEARVAEDGEAVAVAARIGTTEGSARRSSIPVRSSVVAATRRSIAMLAGKPSAARPSEPSARVCWEV